MDGDPAATWDRASTQHSASSFFLAHRGANLRGRGYKDDLKPFAHLYLPASVKLL